MTTTTIVLTATSGLAPALSSGLTSAVTSGLTSTATDATVLTDRQRLAVVLGTAVAALVAVGVGGVWRRLRHVITIAHEGGHAAVAVLVGRRLHGVRLHSDTSGVTVSRGRPTGIGVVLVLLAGYPAPSLLGLLGAFALAHGRTAATLWGAVVLLGLLLLVVRNAFGVVSVVLTAGVLFAVSYAGQPLWREIAAHLLVWFLLLGGVWPVLELQSQRRAHRARQSDADQLAGLVHVPGLVWVGVFLVVTVAAAVTGARLLLPDWSAGLTGLG